MAYTALPDRRMPYDNDGTVVMQGNTLPIYGSNLTYMTGGTLSAFNGYAAITTARGIWSGGGAYGLTTWLFFPEQREVSGVYYTMAPTSNAGAQTLKGSNDTTNGLDGTWETATFTPPAIDPATQVDQWRSGIATVSFTGPKKVVKLDLAAPGGGNGPLLSILHVYGQKGAGQTPDDILYLDGLNAYAEFTAPEDFGNVPLATTTVRTFKVKNASATHTANTVNIQCNDADFAISTDNVTWVATINIASLAAGASSAVLYVRNTSPAVGGALGPRYARIVCTVASYT